MTWLSAIIMGLVQGIAEFLPISSSGHLAIAEHLLNMQGGLGDPAVLRRAAAPRHAGGCVHRLLG